MTDFNPEKLKNPGSEYFPAYSWIWNDVITEDGITKRLDDMLKANIKNIYVIPESKNFRPSYMPTYLEPDYMSDDYVRLFDFAAKEAQNRGMQIWIYDEDGWPSGTCGGKTAENNETIRLKKLKYDKAENGEITFSHFDASGEKYYPNFMLEEATAAFLETTHKKFSKLCGDRFGKSITAVFTDEPHIALDVYDEKVYEGFFEKYGYRIEDHFGALFKELNYNDEKSKKARVDFYEYCTELFAKNYFGKIRKWCNENNLIFTGHVNGDDSAVFIGCSGNLLPLLREMDIPGVDVIYRQIFPKELSMETYTLGDVSCPVETCGNRFFPRFASSVAHISKKNRALAECFAVYGGGMSFDEMRYVINFLAVRGINLFNLMNIPYGSHGHICGGMRPGFTPDMPAYEGLKGLNEYMTQLSYTLSCGTPDIRQAVYMPVRSWWASPENLKAEEAAFTDIGRSIEKCGGDFDIIDDDDILTEGVLTSYSSIFIPGCNWCKDGVKEKLEAFIKNGGKIYTLEDEGICGAKVIEASEAGSLSHTPVKISPRGDIRTTVRTLPDGAKIVFLYNEGFESVSVNITLPENENIYEFNLHNNDVKRCNGSLRLNLLSGQEKVYIIGRDYSSLSSGGENYENELILTDFMVRRVSQFKTDNAILRTEIIDEPFRTVSGGDLSSVFPGDFSGNAVYKTKFNLKSKKAKLVLENVRISASVTLNGKKVTENPLIFSPFEADLTDFIKEGENVLEITVANTVSDEIVNTDFPEEYLQGSYHYMTLPFEERAVGGGIYGKVKILY